MAKLTFFIVDVFAEQKYSGNQLAVFRGGKELSDGEMQRIAQEMHYSETTFILSGKARNDGFDVRIFTPEREVPFAGHPTLGTAHIIRNEISPHSIEKVVLNLKVGQIPVTFDKKGGDIYWMHQVTPTFGKQLSPEAVAPVLSLAPAEVDNRFPVEEVSTGLPFIIVPLRTLESLKKARIDIDKYFDLIRTTWAKGILIFCPQARNPQNHFSVRVFVDYYGVLEDPATGSANGCLAGYLVGHRYGEQASIDVRIEQGYEVGRPSLLYLRAEQKDRQISVFVGGKAITVAKGKFV